MTDWTNKTVDELRASVYGINGRDAADELARKAQANDALRSAAQWVATAERDLQASALVNDGLFNAKLEQLQERCGDLRQALAAAPAPSSSGAPAPADSQREAAIEAFITACTNIDWGQHLLNQGGCFHVEDGRLCGRARTWAGHQGGNHLHLFVPLYVAVTKIAQLRSAPPAPVAPVTAPGDAIGSLLRASQDSVRRQQAHILTLEAMVKKFRLASAEANRKVDSLRNELAATRRAAAPVAPVTDARIAVAIDALEAAAFHHGDQRANRASSVGEEYNTEAARRGARETLDRLIARRVAEARGAGLMELRARLLSTAGSLPNRQMGHSDEDFDRGYVEACENWAQEIDRLLAAPAASKLAEEPAQEDDGPCLSALLANMRMEMSDGANGMRTPREEAIAAVVECVARRIEALENNKEAGQ